MICMRPHASMERGSATTSHKPDDDPAATPAATDVAPVVYVWDARPDGFAHIARIISECGATPCRVNDFSVVDAHTVSMRGQVALVALVECPDASDAPVFRLLSALKQGGARVVCYGEGVGAWPLGKRCEALLAGALAVFDSAGGEFAADLTQALARLLGARAEQHAAEAKLKREMARLGFVGESEAMLAVFRWAMRASALSDLPVLITGETGTGKELLVNAIFQLDEKRRRGPLVAVNCSAVSSALIESELFGHRRGAFTGAERDRKGLIRAAQGGVLFLDEIGDLDLSLQAKLLRVLQEMRVLGVGEEREVAVDVRVIAATNRNLEELVRQGRFRADLFHRLNILSVSLPPLRERPDDLRPLVEHFLRKHRALAADAAMPAIAPDFIEALAQAGLPGNARQLENLVRRALVDKDSDAPLCLSDLTVELWRELSGREQRSNDAAAMHAATTSPDDEHHPAAQNDARPTRRDATPPDLPADLRAYLINLLDINHWNLSDSLAHCERVLVASALEHTGGNQTQTARLLGITPRSVYNKVRKHQLH